ncbi:hypothetical protein IL306_013802 [Fusarium sp. DS 682]|nr:hypothetical protein IL306_013802 [Fusarium sp. DS 682]
MPDATRALPRGWTEDIEAMGGDVEWGPDGTSAQAIKRQGVTDPEPLIGTTTYSGNALFYFTSGSKIYLYNGFEGSIYTVTEPTTEDAIVDLVAKGSQKDIKVERFRGQ